MLGLDALDLHSIYPSETQRNLASDLHQIKLLQPLYDEFENLCKTWAWVCARSGSVRDLGLCETCSFRDLPRPGSAKTCHLENLRKPVSTETCQHQDLSDPGPPVKIRR